jgi:hypothetical protein
VAVHDDERRTVLCVLERGERARQQVQIIGITDAQDVPAVAKEARSNIFCESERGTAFDGDLIIVVDPAQVRELEVSGQGGRFA